MKAEVTKVSPEVTYNIALTGLTRAEAERLYNQMGGLSGGASLYLYKALEDAL